MRLPKKHIGTEPRPWVWLMIAGGLLLPLVGVGAAVYGILVAAGGDGSGWYWAGAGVAIVIADMALDRFWAGGADSEERDESPSRPRDL
jgi:hypothetical protein